MRTIRTTLLAATCILSVGACHPADIVNAASLPSDVTDPNLLRTPAGAMGAYHSAIAQFNVAFGGTDLGNYVVVSGLLADEFQAKSSTKTVVGVDIRNVLEGPAAANDAIDVRVYLALNRARGYAQTARAALPRYAPAQPRALTGQMYAIEAYSEIFLADLFCSGIPLSTIDFDGDFHVASGSSTTDVYRHAIALFDTALVYAADSARITMFAKIGRARALLAVGDFAEAAVGMEDIPTGYSYTAQYDSTTGYNSYFKLSYATDGTPLGFGGSTTALASNEGTNGLPYAASTDPRVQASNSVVVGGVPATYIFPLKFTRGDGSAPIVIADWVEARLITAEAALRRGDSQWLTLLNELRATSGIEGLPPLIDPATQPLPDGKTADDVRVDLLFHERAYWLWLTGHRQGDMRRLVRQYGRLEETVYPTGTYPIPAAAPAYGDDVNLPIPAAESDANPAYHGCIDRQA